MERPVGVTILASLYFFAAGILGLGGIVLIFGRSFFAGIRGPADSGPPPSARDLALMGLFFLVVTLLNVVCGIGFIKLKKWSQVLAIFYHSAWAILWALSLVGLRLHPHSSSLIFRLAGLTIQVWILVYLFGAKVKQAFDAQAT